MEVVTILGVTCCVIAIILANKGKGLNSIEQSLQTAQTGLWQKCRGPVLIGLAVILLLALGCYAYNRMVNAESIAQQAIQVSQQHMQNANALQNELNISKANAQQVADYAANVQAGKVTPSVTYYVQSPTIQDAAQQVQERINQHDTTLPPAAIEKTDRTAVVANTEQQKVDVYKINLDKARLGMNVLVLTGDGTKIGAGPSWKNRDNAVNAGYTNKKRTYFMGTHYY